MPSSYKRTLSEFVQVEPAEKFLDCPIPADVRCDGKLDPSAKMVLLEMWVESKGCGMVLASDTFLATNTGLSRGTVIAARQALEDTKLIEKIGAPVKQVYRYRFLHAEMCGSGEIPQSAKTQRKAIAKDSAPRCLECGATKPISKNGMCGACRTQVRVNREVAMFLEAEPWTSEADLWKELKCKDRCKKFSAGQIESAYHAWHRRRRAAG